MIVIDNKSDCCGCKACEQICPKKCISMNIDSEGFWYPNVNQEKCVDCRLCEKVCPIKSNTNNSEMQKAYAAIAKDENIRLHSSSGGIFTVIAKEILSNNGVVFGAELKDNLRVEHTYIEHEDDLYKLQGSKYVQSDIRDSYVKVKEFLQEGRRVLFTGTECQISGLINYLPKEYDNLYTIDVLCHGVPSPLVWERYLAEKKEVLRKPIESVDFRDKVSGWKKFSISFTTDSKEKEATKFFEDTYMKFFLRNVSLRPSCYKCMFKGLDRKSDITIGDCWGVDKTYPEMDDDKGTSVIIVHTKKGEALLATRKEEIILIESEVDVLLSPTADSRKSVIVHKNRAVFFRELAKGKKLSELEKYIKTTKLDILKRKIRKILA